MNSLPKIFLLLAVGTLVSCQTSGHKKPKPVGPVSSALQSGHWKKVKASPPTYFPKGIAADHPTEFRDGSWVSAGDSQGTQFFIPARGSDLPPEHLIAEAQAAMTPEAQKELARQGRKIAADDIKGKTVEGIAKVLGGLAHAMAHVAASSPGHYTAPKKQPQPQQPAPSPPSGE